MTAIRTPLLDLVVGLLVGAFAVLVIEFAGPGAPGVPQSLVVIPAAGCLFALRGVFWDVVGWRSRPTEGHRPDTINRLPRWSPGLFLTAVAALATVLVHLIVR